MGGISKQEHEIGERLPDDTTQPHITKEKKDNRDTAKSTTPQYMTGFPFYVTFACLLLAALLSSLNTSTISTANPSITNAFHSIQDIGWYSSSYLISNCAMLPLTGQVFAIFPLRSTFIVFLFVFELGNLIAGVAVSSAMVIVGRAITGIGASGILTGVTAIITTIRPLEKRPMLIGIIMGTVAMGRVAGPLLGGALTEISWRWVFFINLPFGGIVMLLFLLVVRLPASPKQQKQIEAMAAHAAKSNPTVAASTPFVPTFKQKLSFYKTQLTRIDFPGFVCFSAACAVLLIGLEWGGTEYAWDSATVIGLLVGGTVLFAVFGAWSIRLGDRALIPPRLLRYGRINVFCGITALLQAASVFVLMAYLPIWFQSIKDATPLMSGVMLLPTIIAQLMASILCGFLVQKTGYYLPEILAGNSFVAIASGLFTTFTPSTSTGHWIGFQILGGVGRGFVMQLLVTVIQANVPASDIPLGVSYVMFCQYFGGAVFVCAARTVLTSTIGASLAKYAPNVNAALVIDTGVTELRSVIAADDITGVIKAYNAAIVNVFYLQLALSGTALVCSSFLGWRDIRKAQPSQNERTEPGQVKEDVP